MKQLILYTIFSLALLLQACRQTQPVMQSDNSKTKEYKNTIYRFSVRIPGNWRLYGQIMNDTVQHRAIVGWGLPPIYSELEKTEIENAISITAYHRANITSVEQLILAEYLRVDPTQTAMEIDSSSENARIIYSTLNGKNYKGKSYFVFKNEIGYVITFMATPGTYDRNVSVFEMFHKRIKFL